MEEGPSASECPVCFIQLSDQRVPMSMPCGHTLCKCCIDLLGSAATPTGTDRKPSFPCPLCRQWVAVDSVTVNVTLRDLLEELRHPQPRPGGGVGTALNVPYGDIKFTEMLDRGAFGEVHRAYWQGYEVAVKVFSTGKLTSEILQAFQREVLVMNSLRHPNVVLLMGACPTPPRLCIVMEFVSGGSLHNLLHIDKVVMAMPHLQQVSLCTCRGLQYLHSINIMHRDLKSKNVLLTGPLPCQAKLCDFGLARLRQENATMTGNVGTVHWTAPEILVNKRYQFPADVYSFGMVLYEMAVNRIPFYDMNPMAVMLAVAIQKQQPPIPPGVHPKLAELIDRCTQWTPGDRPPVGEVLQSLLDLLPIAERVKSHSTTQLELHHTNSLGYVFVLASQTGTSDLTKNDKDTEDGMKKVVEEAISQATPPPAIEPRPPLPHSETGDLQLAMKLQKEEEEARRLQLEADEQLAEQLQNKENTFAVPMGGERPNMMGPRPELLETIKAGHVLKRTQSPKARSMSGDQDGMGGASTPTFPPPPPPPPLPGRSSPVSTKQKVMANIRVKAVQLGKHLRPVTTVEKRAFRVGRVVEEETEPVLTFQYEIANFDKHWLNQVEFQEPTPPFPLGKVHNEKGYPLKGMVQSLSKLWKGDPSKKKQPSPPTSKKKLPPQRPPQPPKPPAIIQSGAKGTTKVHVPTKPSMKNRSVSEQMATSRRSADLSAVAQNRSLSYPTATAYPIEPESDGVEEYDSSDEGSSGSGVRKSASMEPPRPTEGYQLKTKAMSREESVDHSEELLRVNSPSLSSESTGRGEEYRSEEDEPGDEGVEVPSAAGKSNRKQSPQVKGGTIQMAHKSKYAVPAENQKQKSKSASQAASKRKRTIGVEESKSPLSSASSLTKGTPKTVEGVSTQFVGYSEEESDRTLQQKMAPQLNARVMKSLQDKEKVEMAVDQEQMTVSESNASPQPHLVGEGEMATIPGEEVAIPGEEVSSPWEEVIIPGEEVSIPGEEVSIPGEEVSIPGEEVSIPGEEVTVDGERSQYSLNTEKEMLEPPEEMQRTAMSLSPEAGEEEEQAEKGMKKPSAKGKGQTKPKRPPPPLVPTLGPEESGSLGVKSVLTKESKSSRVKSKQTFKGTKKEVAGAHKGMYVSPLKKATREAGNGHNPLYMHPDDETKP